MGACDKARPGRFQHRPDTSGRQQMPIEDGNGKGQGETERISGSFAGLLEQSRNETATNR
jgi:hypothetical protein